MLSTLKVIKSLIFALIIIFLIYKIKVNYERLLSYLPHFPSISKTEKYSASFSQFIALEGADEYVISGLKTVEKFEDHWATKKLGVPVASVDASISLVASFKYYVKLGELKYTIEDDTLIFNVPKLYLSTPVAYDSSTIQRKCDADGFAICKGTQDGLLTGVTEKLEVKGNLALASMYDKSAKTLADNFDNFAKKNRDEDYNNIAVIFANEPGQSRHIFNFNKNRCGKEPCALEVPVGNGGFLTTQ